MVEIIKMDLYLNGNKINLQQDILKLIRFIIVFLNKILLHNKRKL
jgi:hypothetical protein